MKTSENKARILEAAVESRYDYETIGVRVQEQPFELGSIEHLSHVWDDGEDTGEELGGICCTAIDLLDAVDCEYYGDHVAIIGGSLNSYGEDAGEIIIEDAEVLAIIC